VVEDIRGTVVRLAGNHWQEVAEGERMGISAVLQSLTRSSANLRSSSLTLELGPDTALAAEIRGNSGAVSLDQYSGTIEVAFATNSAMTLSVRTPGLVVSSSGGKLSIEVNDTITEIAVQTGVVKAVDTESGRVLVLHDGQSTDDLRAEIVVSSVSPSGTQVGEADGDGKPGDTTKSEGTLGANDGSSASSDSGGNTGASASGSSASNALGSPSSIAGGNTTSQSDGTTHSDAGSNDNSNADRTPISNAGGNSSNADRSQNSNADGNDVSSAGGNNTSHAGESDTSNAGSVDTTDGEDATSGGKGENNAGGVNGNKSTNGGKGA
jgi:hypothetical protein